MKEEVGTSIKALTQEAAVSEVSRIQALVAARYDDHLLSLTDAERSDEEAIAEAAGSSGYQLFTEWSHRGVVRSLWTLRMRIPVASPLSATPRERASRFLEDHGAIFGLSSGGSALQVERTGPREGGGTVVRLKEVLRGLPVFGSGLVLHVGLEGDIEWLAGLVLPENEVAAAAATPALTADMAAAAASGTAFGSELGWFDQEAFGVTIGPPRLSWRVRSTLGSDEYDVYVDAATGSELARVSLINDNEHKEIFYCNGCHPNTPPPYLPGSIQYDDVCHDTGEAQCPPDWCPYGYCQNPSPTWEGTSQYIYTNTNYTYDYYLGRHGRDSWDNGQCGHGHPTCTDENLHRIQALSDTAVGNCNAQWRYFIMSYAPAQANFDDQIHGLDVVGHEFTHGVDNIEGNMSYESCTQSMAMKEAFSDIFGELIEKYSTGSADWVHGTGNDPCPLDRKSSLKDPKSYEHECDTNCSGSGEPLPQPDHWSMYRRECNGHWNSTVLSKAGYLMGREMSEGFESHWGMSVRGIGEVAASKVLYKVLTEYLSGAATFSNFRNAIYDSCQYYCTTLSLCNYSHCINSVDAVGLWSLDTAESWEIYGTVDMAYWTVSGQPRWYIFYRDKGTTNLRYRYRTCIMGGPCSWSSPTTFDSSSHGPSAAVLPGSYMVVCFRNGAGNAIWCDKMDSSGNLTAGPDISTSINGQPSLVYFYGTLYIAYRKSDNSVYWRKYNTASNTWGAENSAGFISYLPPVLASSREDLMGPDDNYLWIVYASMTGGRLAYRLFNPGTSTWGPERTPGRPDDGIIPASTVTPGVSFFRDRLHITALDSGNKIRYLSCKMPCSSWSTDWTMWVEQDPSAHGDLTMDNYGASDGYLYLWHRLDPSNQLNRRCKKSW